MKRKGTKLVAIEDAVCPGGAHGSDISSGRNFRAWLLAIGGLVVGVLFGAFAQQSRFCLRAASLEFSRGAPKDRLPVWLLTFSAAVLCTQVLIHLGEVQANEARQLASPQSLSGALLGGLMFGTGMVLARGCASPSAGAFGHRQSVWLLTFPRRFCARKC